MTITNGMKVRVKKITADGADIEYKKQPIAAVVQEDTASSDTFGKFYIVELEDGTKLSVRQEWITPITGSLDKVEFMNIPLFEKKDPIFMSKIIGVPVVIWGAGFIAYHLLKKGSR